MENNILDSRICKGKGKNKKINECYLRKASFEDAFCLFSWKNEEETLKNSRNSNPISWEEHVNWLEASLRRTDRWIWMLEKNGEKLASLRFDLREKKEGEKAIEPEKSVEISYIVAPQVRGKGYGQVLLAMAEEQAQILGMEQLYGQVLLHNHASRKLFQRMGYLEKMEEKVYTYRKAINTIFFRVDMNEKVATGHVMRCLSVADAAGEQGIRSIFITSDEKPVSMISGRGHETVILHSSWNEMEKELEELKKVIFQLGIHKLLVDSYQVTWGYLEELSKLTQVYYLDDLDGFSYPVQNIICYANYYHTLSYGDKKEEKGYYLGMEYVPLRKVFQGRKEKVIREKVESILILSGGSDPVNMIPRILRELIDGRREEAIEEKLFICIICGSLYDDFEKLREEYGKQLLQNVQVEFHKNVREVEVYMERADLAISAGGTTLYELAAMGVPTITYSFADNQLKNVLQFSKEQLMDYGGDGRKLGVEKEIKRLCEIYKSNPQLRRERSIRMQKLMDGKGAQRIAQLLR